MKPVKLSQRTSFHPSRLKSAIAFLFAKLFCWNARMFVAVSLLYLCNNSVVLIDIIINEAVKYEHNPLSCR